MKAIVYHNYGSPEVLLYEDIEKPSPADKEVLIEIYAASVNPLDWHFMRGRPYLMRIMSGLRKPKNTRPGVDVAGHVEAVGRNVTQFKPGDAVFGSCYGAFAEYVCTSESSLVIKPENVTFEQAASVPVAALTALQGLRDKGKIQSGQRVLVDGSSGGVGTFAVQIAKSFGTEVTAVCSTRNEDMMRSIGADYVIDYTQSDFTQHDQRYDLILAANGYHSVFDYKRSLIPGGIFVMTGGSMALLSQLKLLGPWISMTSGKKMGSMLAKLNQKDLVFMKERIEEGKVKPVIDRRYSLSEVAEAVRYLEEGHARGKVVITVEHHSKT
jgi:NADPH:quinone reductase-like Zn-dependent oxidoreductase